jgi:hypothetical protein
MEPAVIMLGLLLFLACMALHIAIWRVRTPWVSSAVLLVLFLALPVVVMAAAAAAGAVIMGLRGTQLVAALVLHCSIALAYIASYPAVRAVSPSLDILLMIEASGSGRMTEEELREGFARKRLVGARIDDLEAYRLIVKEERGFCLTRPAAVIVAGFLLYRKLLGLPAGGG